MKMLGYFSYFVWLVTFSIFSFADAYANKDHYLQVFFGMAMIFWAIMFEEDLK